LLAIYWYEGSPSHRALQNFKEQCPKRNTTTRFPMFQSLLFLLERLLSALFSVFPTG